MLEILLFIPARDSLFYLTNKVNELLLQGRHLLW